MQSVETTTSSPNNTNAVLCAVNQIKPMSLVKITKCSIKEYVGFVGTLYTNLRCFHANAGRFSMLEVLMIDKDKSCIGIIGNNGAFWWTEESDFDVEVCLF